MATVEARVPVNASVRPDAARQAFRLLHLGFVVAPVVAGADKFFNLLADWTVYLPPFVPDLLGISAQGFMYLVGGIEIVAGILVAVRPRVGGLVVAAWLVGIIVNLLILGEYYDVALRDLGLAIGALALSRLATAYGEPGPG